MLSTLRDGIDNVVIQFDDEERFFHAGKPITGKILVVCTDTTAVRAIRLKLNGTMNIFWHDKPNKVDHAEFEDYLTDEVTVWEPKKGETKEWMFPGQHEYPFSYTLSEKLPDSLHNSEYGKIVYWCKAGVYMTQGRVTHSLEENFSVQAMALSAELKQEEGILPEDEMPKENYAYGTIGGSCFTSLTYVEVFIKLKKSHYRLGDTIDVEVRARVEGGRSDIDKVTAILVQETIFSDKIDTPKESESIKELLVFAEATDEDDTNSGETRTYNLQLEIDEHLPLTSFPNCDFANIEYYIHAVARTHSFYDDIVVKLPIVIDAADGGDASPEDVEADVGSLENDGDGEEEEKEGSEDGDEGAAAAMLVDVEDEDDEDKGTDDEQEKSDKDDDEDEDKSEAADDDDASSAADDDSD